MGEYIGGFKQRERSRDRKKRETPLSEKQTGRHSETENARRHKDVQHE